jgi:hypothetical protein
VKSYESFDPTDAFGQNTRVYVNKNRVVKIEPHFSSNSSHLWLTDKGRLFFDSVFGKIGTENLENIKTTKEWENLFRAMNKTFYVFNICNFKYASRHFFIIILENVSIEILNFLSVVSKINSFIKVKRAEKSVLNSDFETNFQMKAATSISKLSFSSLCLIVGANPRYEGSSLNLKLRQRYLKGDFKLLVVGPALDLTFPVSFLGSSTSILKSVSEGNHTLCKDIVHAENPMFVTNTETLKHSNLKEFFSISQVLKYSKVLNATWDGFNVLNSSLSETGLYTFSRLNPLVLKDLVSFSSFYVLNVNLSNISNIKATTESRLLKHRSSNKFFSDKLLINQDFNSLPLNFSRFVGFKKYLYLPSSTFFENQKTYVNTEGFRKISSKLITRKNMKSDWQLLRKFVQSLLMSKNLSCNKDSRIVFYDSNSLFDFKNFINFHFQAALNLTNLNEYVLTGNQKFVVYKKFYAFKCLTQKLVNSKLKYWLDDFYTGGKDHFCQNSLGLSRCSSNYRLQVTNFF